MTTPVYGIFEGGGAKGLAHIAGVAAAEKNNLEFIGVAGASAGALIASLVAVGYRAKDLFDPNNPSANLLNRHQISPLSIIGEREFALFDKAEKQRKKAMRAALIGGWLGARIFAPATVNVAQEVQRDGGYFSTQHIREHLNYFLRVKLMQHHADAAREIDVPERVRFKDIDPANVPECCSLKVIVTDISSQKLVVFDNSPEYQDVEVAEAVAASISIPFVFKPAKITSYSEQPNSVYADGGLVSNLPIWVFEEEKLNFERAQVQESHVTILGFTLTEETKSTSDSIAPKESMYEYVSNVAKSAIFGGQAVATQFVPDILPVPMPSPLRTTQFNFSIKQAIDAYHRAYSVAALVLGRQIRVRPTQVQRILEDFQTKVITEIQRKYSNQPITHMRVSIIQPFGDSSFRVVQSFNMTSDADDRLIFSKLADGAPSAFRNRSPAYLDFSTMYSAGCLPANMTKYEFAYLRKSLQSAICFPIFKEPEAWEETNPDSRPYPIGAVSIDSDVNLEHIFSDSKLLEKIAVLTMPFNAVLQP